NFALNLIFHIQPPNQGSTQRFKAHHPKDSIAQEVARYDAGHTPADIYIVNQFEVKCEVQNARDDVDVTIV
ncbi:hypothetical protein P691DRAFT_616377, partial [Macrolepiota fuliginosa MF-IS2]